MVDNAHSRNLQPTRASFFLFGLRGVGKSTWARQRFATAMHVNLLDEGVYHSFLRDPSRFAEELRGRPRGSWVVVDEVQRLPVSRETRASPGPR